MSDNDEQIDDIEVRVEKLEDSTLRTILEELCLKGNGSDPITKDALYSALNKPL